MFSSWSWSVIVLLPLIGRKTCCCFFKYLFISELLMNFSEHIVKSSLEKWLKATGLKCENDCKSWTKITKTDWIWAKSISQCAHSPLLNELKGCVSLSLLLSPTTGSNWYGRAVILHFLYMWWWSRVWMRVDRCVGAQRFNSVVSSD